MRAMIKMLLVATMPLIAAGCQSSTKVENVTVTNDSTATTVDANAIAPTDDGMINYAAPDTSGNASAK